MTFFLGEQSVVTRDGPKIALTPTINGSNASNAINRTI